MKYLTIALIPLVLLTSCAQTPTGSGGFYVPVYSQERRERVAQELETYPVAETIEFMKDYKVLRDQVRVK